MIGKFAVRSAAGILPDGTPFNIPLDTDHPVPLELPEAAANNVVCLMLPARQAGALETAPPELKETAARFSVAEHEAIDTNTGYQSIATLPVGKLRLRFGTEERAALGMFRSASRASSRCAPIAR
jgi:type VI secretion system protein ImpJ